MARSSSPRPPSSRKPRAPKGTVSIPKVVSMVPPPLDTVPAAPVPADAVPPDPARPDPAPLDPTMVAVRAYELFLESGAVHGHDIEHWLRAERQLLAERLTSAA